VLIVPSGSFFHAQTNISVDITEELSPNVRMSHYNDPNNVGNAYQGTFGIQGDHTGFMHPNYWGHQRYATSYVNALVNALPFT
jgi:hypothetical protein